jgi:glycosyltransferase involved in cell wall biosynthesis
MRLHQGLRKIGLDSRMLVQSKAGDDPAVVGPQGKIARGLNQLRPTLDGLPLQFYLNRQDIMLFSPGWLPSRIHHRVAGFRPDVVHFHWICNGFVPVTALHKFTQPLVWTLHDCWPFTGGCHYPLDCRRYQEACGACPQLNSHRHRDLSHRVWNRKARHWPRLNLTVVTPSRWLATTAQSSSLFREARIEIIPYGLDLNRYKPVDRQIARGLLGLPQDQKLILWGALGGARDHRKGFTCLQSALQFLAANGWYDKARLMVFGCSEPSPVPDMGLRADYLGVLHDDISLRLLYAATDVFIAPSIQDNLPNVVMEALACGTPAVAFNIGGMPDLIDHKQNGYLARPFETADLASGLEWILSDDSRHHDLRRAARDKVEKEYELAHIAQRYEALYQEILDNR